ncbi:hypothetical protein [Mesorhizobium sp.]|uniref:hypothetical protein n=1 Tax=Mesorhizobium sp. TaxID=1871066 RepID=UPI00257AE841|nr:hypothetical protein [Mesorhizobium sp.]
MTEDQIKAMVDRFLMWRLPEDFNPDDGISFKATFNEHTAHPMRHRPVGTNLLTAVQAEAMVRYMVEDMAEAEPLPKDTSRFKKLSNVDDATQAVPDVIEARKRLQWIIDERYHENADLDTICTHAKQALAALASHPVPAVAVKGLADQVLDFFKAARDEGLFIGAGRDRRLPNNEESQYGPKAKALLAAAQAAAIAPATQAVPDMVRPVCRVMTMQHSSGAPDHYVSIEVGDRQITPHMFKTKGRAEYEVAEWNWLLNGVEKPYILDFDTDPLPLATDPDADLKEKVAAANIRLASLSPEQQAAHWDAQRESFVRGQLMD